MRTPLRGRRQFAAVRASRAHSSVGVMRVHAARNQLPSNRVGIALPKIAHAVDRNRIRRRIRAALVPLLARLNDGEGLDLVISARPGVTAAPFRTLNADLSRSLDAAVSRARTVSG